MHTSKEIRQKISKLLIEQQEIALAGFNAESRQKFDRIQKDVDQFEADASRLEAMEARASAERSFTPVPRPASIGESVIDRMSTEERTVKTKAAFKSYALRGIGGMTVEERDLITTGATGQAVIPQLFNPELIAALKYYGPTAQLVRQRVTDNNGAPIKVSLANDTANGLTLLSTEGTSSPAETDPAFQSSIVGVDTLTAGLVKISFQELEDSSFDLDTWIREAFGLRYARGLETAVTTGKDTSGTALPNQSSGGLAGVAVVGTTTSALANGIGWDDLTATYGAVDPAYSTPTKGRWVMNSSTRSYLLGLKDGFGRPYFVMDPANDAVFGRLAGFEVVINQAMPSMGANAVPILFGSLNDAYLLRTDGQPTILRLNERYADTLEVGFLLFTRAGGTTIVATSAPNPLVSLKQAAS